MDAIPTQTSTLLLQQLAATGDQSTWRLFDARYRPVLAGYLRRSFTLRHDEAEEAAQETLAQFALAYRAGKYQREKGRLRSWLMGIARNVAHAARRARRGVSAGDFEPPDPVHQEAVWDQEQSRHIAVQAWDALRANSRFDERTLRAFEFAQLRGMDTAAVAATCSMSEDEVYVAKSRVARKLQQIEMQLREAYEVDS